MVPFDVAWYALGLDEGRAEEDERVGWARDVAHLAFLCMGRFGSGDAWGIFLGYKLEARSLSRSHVDV